MNLPGYDEWKLEGHPGHNLTEAEQKEIAKRYTGWEQELRDAIAYDLADWRGGLYLATIRRIVIEELNKLRPSPGEPAWQSKTPIPVPGMG